MANYVKFLRVSLTAYNNLSKKDKDTLYFITEEQSDGSIAGKLYLGEVAIAGSLSEGEVIDFLSELRDVKTEGAVQNSLLGFDSNRQLWVPMDIKTLVNISEMTGATTDKDGGAGIVPAPKAGEEMYYLRGDGTWAQPEIDLSEYINEKELEQYLAEYCTETEINQLINEQIGTPGTPAIGELGEEGYIPATPGTGIYQNIYSKDEVTDLIADITGGETAGDVKAELTAYKTLTDATISTILQKVDTVAVGAEKNVIQTVNTDELSIVTDFDNGIDRRLELVAVPVVKLSGISTDDFTLDTTNNTLSIKAVGVEKITGLSDNYISKATYEIQAGPIDKLVHASGNDNSTIIDEVNFIIDKLTWKNMDE